MEVTYLNQPEDILAVRDAMTGRDEVRDYTDLRTLSHFVWPSMLLCVVLQEWYVLAGLGTLVTGIVLVALAINIRGRMNLVKTAKFPGRLTIRLTEDFLEVRHEGGGARRPWSYVRRIADRPEHLVLFLQDKGTLTVPKEFFATPQAGAQFLAEAQRLHAERQNRPLPSFDWQDFLRELEIDDQNLIQHLHWEYDPRLTARLQTLGLNLKTDRAIATAWTFLQQLITLLILVPVLLAMRYFSLFEIQVDKALYYILLAMAIFTLLAFGFSFVTRSAFMSELQRQQQASGGRDAWFYEHGVGTLSNESICFVRWQIIERIVDDPEAIVLYNRVPFLHEVIPKSVFSDEEQSISFLERIQVCHEAAHDQYDDTILAEITNNPFQSPGSA